MNGRNTIFGSFFALYLLLPSFTLAAEAPVSTAPLQQQIVEALAQGRDASALIAQFKLQRGAGTGSPLPLRSDVNGDLQQRLLTLEQTLQRGSPNIATVLSQYESVVAAHLLVKDRFDIVGQRLADDQASAAIAARNQDARAAYDQTMGQLDAALGALLAEWQSNREIASTEAFRSRASAGISAATKVLAANASRSPVQILRANTLPFRPGSLAQRAPKLTPTIVPSYLTPLEASAPPQAADTSDSVDAPLSEEILRQARELGYDYIRIYEFVRNNVRTEWYAGSMKGAVGTLRQKSGNDVDQAALLVALFRASGLASRYVHGVIELPIEQVGASLGISDPQKVVAALQAAGVAFAPVIRGGRVAVVNIEHTWVSAHAPYTNYRGAVVDASGKTWVPLAPAVKTHVVTPFVGVFAQAGLGATPLVDDYLSAVQAGTLLGNVRTRVGNYLTSSGSTSTYEQAIGTTSVTAQTIGLLPNTLPVAVVAVTGESAALDDAHRQRVRITVRQGDRETDKIIVDYTAPLSSLASERVTLSYMPATNDDHKTVNLFGGLDYTPAYLIKLRPQIKVNGRAKSVGQDSLSPGQLHRFAVQIISPARTETVEQVVGTGGYHAIGLYSQGVARVVPQDDAADTEFTAARLLDRIAYSYVDRWNTAEREFTSLLNVAAVHPLPHVAIVSNSIKVETVLGRAMAIKWQGVTLDAALRVSDPIARDSTANAARDFMRLSALEGSTLEQQIFSDEFLVDSISADKGLRLARLAGQEILTINSANATAQLALANLAPEVEADIANWARLGFTVESPRNPLAYLSWSGAAWRVLDNTSGGAGYFIAGGLAGGASAAPPDGWSLDWLRDALAGANTPAPNTDPLSGAHVMVIGGDTQSGVVGQELERPLSVIVRDSHGSPVRGARVTFKPTAGGSTLIFPSFNSTGAQTEQRSETEAVVSTNALGIASVRLETGIHTSDSPTYVANAAGDDNLEQVGQNIVDVSVATSSGNLSIAKPFIGLASADVPVALARTNACCNAGNLPDSAHDIINVRVVDQYQNPVSNVSVNFNLVSVGGTPGVLYGNCHACGQGSALVLSTYVSGSSVTLVMGTATSYTLNVTSAVGTYSRNYALDTTPGFVFFFTRYSDSLGRTVAAAAPGTVLGAPINGGYVSYANRAYRPWPVEDVRFLSGSGGIFSLPVPTPGQPGHYTARMTMGLPGFDRSTQRAQLHNPDYPGVPDSEASGGPWPRYETFFLTEAFSTTANVTGLFSGSRAIERIAINEGGFPQEPLSLGYSINPSTYEPASLNMDILRDGALVDTIHGDTTAEVGTLPLARDGPFDITKPYQAQVVLNRGWPFEIKSAVFDLPLNQKIILSYTRDVHVRRRVDALNQRVCTLGSGISFTTTQNATLTLIAEDVTNPGATTTVFSQSFPAGDHTVPITPTNLPPARYTFTLRALSAVDGHTEEVVGKMISEYIVTDRMPVGHVMVKGVDIKHGQLALGTKDLSVPGRGVGLEFRRSYTSNAPYRPGVLGARWSHNYQSSIYKDECGEYVVSGGEGSGMTFVGDGAGGLRPLKGYHGTLIQNAADRSFDFYSKDGTRYHYRLFGSRTDWDLEFIQDTNGNLTRLGYDPTSATVAKLITVEDSAKRTLKFTYDSRPFDVMSGTLPVITKVEGPDGQIVEFLYDALANLVEVRREAIKTERYTYSPLTQSPVSSQVLTRYTDPNGHSTSYVYNAGAVTINSAGGGNFVLANAFVTDVQEPEGGVTHFAFDQSQWLTTTVTDARNHATVYTMDAYGSPLSTQDPAGTSTMTWASNDVLMTSKSDAKGVRTDFTYDANGNVLTETVAGATTTYTFQSFTPPFIKNRVHTLRDRENRTTTYSYDARGNLTSERNPENGVTIHTYAANGDRLSTRDPRGNETRFTYDVYGNPETERDALGGLARTDFNVRSLPVRVVDPLGRISRLEYDTLGRLVKQTNPLGGERAFTYDAAGNKLTERDEAGRTTTWIYDRESRNTRIDNAAGDHKAMAYDLVGNKTSESDWRGNVTSFEYDDANRLITKTEPLGKVSRFTHDPVGNVLTERDALNRLTQHEYDALNRLTKTTDARDGEWLVGYDAMGNKTSERDALLRTTSYVYDGLDRLTRKTEPLGRVTQSSYDANGNKVSETDPIGGVRTGVFDALDRVTLTRDALGNDTNYEYDAVGNLTIQIDPRLSRERHEYDVLNRRIATTDAGGFVKRFEYDEVGNKTAEVWPNGNRVTFVYDSLSRLTSTSDSIGFVSSTQYDADGRATVQTDANSHATSSTFDALGRLTRVDMPEARTISYGYDLVGNKTSETDARNFTTTYAYDELNRLTRFTDPLSRFIAYTYDAVGNKLTEADKRNNVSQFQYDALNQVTQAIDPLSHTVLFTYDLVGNKKSESDKRGTITTFTYDRESRLTETTKGGVRILATQYDEVGNKEHETDANGNISTFVYDPRNLLLTESRPLAAVTRFVYNSVGDRAEVRDSENRTSVFAFDLRRRLLTQTDGANQRTTYSYDGVGNRLTVIKPMGNTSTSVYDAANRLSTVTDPLLGVTRFTYDRNGNKLTQVDANNHTTAFEYDELNRQTAMVYADGRRVEFRYDNNGNRSGLTDAKGLVFSNTFDALNRETLKTYPLPSPVTGDDIQSIASTYDANGNLLQVTEAYTGATGARVTTNAYDNFDRLIERTDAFGERLRYQYDANGNRASLTDSDGVVTRYAFDALNRVSTVTNSAGVTTYQYDRSSLLTRTEYPNGTLAINTYDNAMRVEAISNRQGSSTISTYSYTYDANGNRLTQREENGGVAQTTSYTYDANDRLLGAGYPDKTTTYTYDATYNRLTELTVAGSVTEANKVFGYNNRNQLTSIADAVSAAGNVTYGYDFSGNQTIKTKNGVTTTFVYDVRDQLISVRQDVTTLGLFRYDYQGLRIRKDMGGQIVRYTYDDDAVLMQSDNTGATIAKYDYGADRLLSLAHASEGRQFYLFDAQGSVSNLANQAGSIQARYQYDAFGNIRSSGGSSYNRFTFTGHEKDGETGLIYFKARFYDPEVGRFLSQDSNLGESDTPPSLHRYLYAYSNPNAYVDLDGHAPIKMGYVYVLEVTRGDVTTAYVGSAKTLKKQLGADEWRRINSPSHSQNRSGLMGKKGATIRIYEAYGEPNKKASSRGTERSAHNEGLRSVEEEVRQKVESKPGVRMTNRIRAATVEHMTKWKLRQKMYLMDGGLVLTRVAGKWKDLGSAMSRGLSKGVARTQAPLLVWDAVNFAREMEGAKYLEVGWVLKDDKGFFTLQKDTDGWTDDWHYAKQYVEPDEDGYVSAESPRLGEPVQIPEDEYDQWVEEGQATWGTKSFWGGPGEPGLFVPEVEVVDARSHCDDCGA